jgi:hypothetical protein
MPWLNRVLQEYGIHHDEYKIPIDVLATLEKKKDAAAKNIAAAAEARKRKGVGLEGLFPGS